MAPCAFMYVDGRVKSAKPPRTRKGAAGFLRGYLLAKDGTETLAHILVSLPTLPHLMQVQ